MNLRELAKILDATVHCGEDKLDCRISYACAGDLMSDILVFSQANALLITGLVNVQVVRTAEMLDIAAIILIRGKTPTEEMIALARQKHIPLLTTEKEMYLCSGLLYEAGIKNVPPASVKTDSK